MASRATREAVAETIENNVRSKIIKEHLNDPAFYDKMSALLDEIIAARKAKAIEYEEYLKRIAELAKKVEAGPGRGQKQTPKTKPTAGAACKPASRSSRELCMTCLQDVAEVERIFLIIKQQREY